MIGSLFRKVRTFVTISYFFVFSIGTTKKAKFLTPEETISISIKYKKPIIRLGDGEFNILAGRGVHYQSYSPKLNETVEMIIKEYINLDGNTSYILAMPAKFLEKCGIELLKNKAHFFSWSRTRYLFKRNYDLDIPYGDSFVFSVKNEDLYRQLWDEYENVIFVHHDKQYSEYFEKIYNKKVSFVKIEPRNSFENRDNILKNILNEIDGNYFHSIVLISAGPCAKFLVYELSKRNIYAIDTGHCWDDPLR